MREFAHKLITINEKQTQDVLPSVIFGSAGSLGQSLIRRPDYRIGLWPLTSDDEPHIALGFMNALGHHLEQYRSVQVYRLFVKLPELDNPNDYEWVISDSQFEIDDWQLDDLDENVAIWGALKVKSDSWVLEIEVEIDDNEDEDNPVLEYKTADLKTLINQLPEIASDIANEIGFKTDLFDLDLTTTSSDSFLRTLLKQQFEWQRNLMLSLWGKTWSEDNILDGFDGLLQHISTEDNFVKWSTAQNIIDATLPGYTKISPMIVELILENKNTFQDQLTTRIVARKLFDLGHPRIAIDMLNDIVTNEANSKSTSNWQSLAELQWRAGRAYEAIKTCQHAISNDAISGSLLSLYQDILLLVQNPEQIEDFVYIDSDEYDETSPQNLAVFEGIEAMRTALKLGENQDIVLKRQLSLQISVLDIDTAFWHDFARLIDLDETGEYISEIIDEMYELDDIQPAIDALRKLSTEHTNRFDIKLNLAFALIVDEQDDEAVDILEALQDETEDEKIINESERLLLLIDDPQFELKLNEFEQILDAGNTISSDDVDYLEDLLEKVPILAEAYIVLAKAYRAWDEDETALEALVDGHAELPDNPAIIELMATIVWDSGDSELALEYLQKGLKVSPQNVPLLALMGQYLYEEDYIEASRAYLAKAEAISPRHPALMLVKKELSKLIASGKDSGND